MMLENRGIVALKNAGGDQVDLRLVGSAVRMFIRNATANSEKATLTMVFTALSARMKWKKTNLVWPGQGTKCLSVCKPGA